MSIVWPGAGRLTLVALAVVPAAMSYPWQTTTGKWALGIAVALTIILLGWWGGQHFTTIARRRLGLLRAPSGGGAHQLVAHAGADASTTALLRVLPDSDGELPLSLLAGYLDRYGLKCAAARITSRDNSAGRTTWIGLTMSAAPNLTALQARSPEIPLRETAEITMRRLADHLRELGWLVTTSDVDVPDMLGPEAKEKWRAVEDGSQGYLAAYAVSVDDSLAETLAGLSTLPAQEVWTTLAITPGSRVSVACAIRTAEAPDKTAPASGLTALRGRQRAAVEAISPDSTEVVGVTADAADVIDTLSWPTSRVSVTA